MPSSLTQPIKLDVLRWLCGKAATRRSPKGALPFQTGSDNAGEPGAKDPFTGRGTNPLSREWCSRRLAAREADLLPAGYFHVVFTLSAQIADIAAQNKAAVYDLLFHVGVADHAHQCRRSPPSRRGNRPHRRAPQLGLGAQASYRTTQAAVDLLPGWARRLHG